MPASRVSTLCVIAAVGAVGASAQSLRGLGESITFSALQSTEDYSTLILNAVNAERTKRGLSSLCLSKKLQSAAQTHSEQQARSDKCSKEGTGGSTPAQRVSGQSFEWKTVAENVASTTVSAVSNVESIVSSWLASKEHSETLLGNYKFLGVGCASNNGGTTTYWTHDLATSDTEDCDDDSAVGSLKPQPDSTITPVPTQNPQPTKEPVPSKQPEPQPQPTKTSEPSKLPQPEPQPTTKPVPSKQPEPQPQPTKEPVPSKQPEPQPQPTKTSEPSKLPQPEPQPTTKPVPSKQPEPQPQPTKELSPAPSGGAGPVQYGSDVPSVTPCPSKSA